MKPRILLIDDMPSMLLAMERDLADGPWQLVRADSFHAAHRRLLEQPPHLIICDYQLDSGKTVEDVIQLTRDSFFDEELRFAGLPFIALSASDEQLQTLTGNPNLMALQGKPFGGELLLNAVQAALQTLEVARWIQKYPVPKTDAPRPELAPATFGGTNGTTSAGFGAARAETFSAPVASEPVVPSSAAAKAPSGTIAPKVSGAELEPIDAGEPVEPDAVAEADAPEPDGSSTAGSLAPPEDDVEPTEPASPGRPAIVLREPLSPVRMPAGPAFAPEDSSAERDLALTSEVLDDPAVRSAIRAAVERLTGGEVLLSAPTSLARVDDVIAWARKDGRSLVVRLLSASEIVAVFVRSGQLVGVGSDAWPNDSRAEALRGRVLSPAGASDGADTSAAQLDALGRGRGGEGWVEVHQQLPPRWAALQDEMVRATLNGTPLVS